MPLPRSLKICPLCVPAVIFKFALPSNVGTGTSPGALLREAGWPGGGADVLVVGHQPTLGEAAAKILGVAEGDLAIRKGAIWWLVTRGGEGNMDTVLKAVVAPDLLDD